MGVGTSIACAIHCALLPLVLTSLPLFGINIIHNNAFEFFMIGLAFCIGAFSLYHGWEKHHRNILPILLFSLGMAFLFAKQLWTTYHLWFLLPAVALIISAHYFNYKFCKKSKCCSSYNCTNSESITKSINETPINNNVANALDY